MKIKGSGSIKLKTLSIVSAVLFGLLFALRLYQINALTDPETGFFTDHSNFTVILFYILAIGSVLATVVMAYPANLGKAGKPEAKSPFLAVGSVLFAVPLAIDGIRGLQEVASASAAFGSFRDAVNSLGGYIFFVAPLFAVLSAVVFVLAAVSFLTGNLFVTKLRICLLIPVLWAFFTTIGYFTITASYIKVAQLMLTIFADAFLMLFLFSFARFVSGIGIEEAHWSFFATGLIAEGLLAAGELPNLLYHLISGGEIVNCGLKWFNLAALVFVAAALVYGAKSRISENAEG